MDRIFPPPQAAFDAIIFDCDGVLVDSEVVGLKDSAAYLKRRGLEWSEADLVERFSGLRDDQFFDLLSEAYQKVNGTPPEEAFFSGLYDQRLLSDTPIIAMEGVHEALRDLHIPSAVASSSRTDRLETKLKSNDLWAYFDPHIYSADVVERGKPDPAIYLYAAEKLGVAPGNCLVVEDSANGVQSGIAAGMTVWGFTGGGHCFEGHGKRLLDAGASWIAPGFKALSQRLSQHQPC